VRRAEDEPDQSNVHTMKKPENEKAKLRRSRDNEYQKKQLNRAADQRQ